MHIPVFLRVLGLLVLLPLAGVGTARKPSAQEPAAAPLSLEVDLSERVLIAYVGDEQVDTFPVAVGQPSYPTPKGSYHVGRVVWNPRWIPPDSKWAKKKKPTAPGDPNNPMGRVKMYFLYPDYYIHSTPDEDSLGKAESHGCIRMRTSDAIDLAQLVMDHGGQVRDKSWFEKVLDHFRTTRKVDLTDPVPLEIHS
ncbi:MAG TPA: L,D-transpeptidase [Longimicrobiaceae bacterium]|nr:L,D-transpeptidase [Longimicrobiaceae bacterium]